MIEKVNSKFGIIGGSDISQLMALASRIENGPILEIGTWLGKSAYAMACSKKEHIVIHCVDPFSSLFPGSPQPELKKYYYHHNDLLPEQYVDYLENLILSNNGDYLPATKFQLEEYLDSIIFHRSKSQDFVLDFKPEFAFIDGGHTFEECLSDIEKVIINDETLIAIHDYDQPDVKEACDSSVIKYNRESFSCHTMFYIVDKDKKFKQPLFDILSKENINHGMKVYFNYTLL